VKPEKIGIADWVKDDEISKMQHKWQRLEIFLHVVWKI
jgi:hypothetical protein